MTTGPRRALPMCRLIERRVGNTLQLTGRLGESQIVIVASGATDSGERLFSMYLQEAPPTKPGERKIGPAVYSRQRAELMFSRRP